MYKTIILRVERKKMKFLSPSINPAASASQIKITPMTKTAKVNDSGNFVKASSTNKEFAKEKRAGPGRPKKGESSPKLSPYRVPVEQARTVFNTLIDLVESGTISLSREEILNLCKLLFINQDFVFGVSRKGRVIYVINSIKSECKKLFSIDREFPMNLSAAPISSQEKDMSLIAHLVEESLQHIERPKLTVTAKNLFKDALADGTLSYIGDSTKMEIQWELYKVMKPQVIKQLELKATETLRHFAPNAEFEALFHKMEKVMAENKVAIAPTDDAGVEDEVAIAPPSMEVLVDSDDDENDGGVEDEEDDDTY